MTNREQVVKAAKASKIVAAVLEEARGLLEPGEAAVNPEYSRAVGELCARVILDQCEVEPDTGTPDLAVAVLVVVQSAVNEQEAMRICYPHLSGEDSVDRGERATLPGYDC